MDNSTTERNSEEDEKNNLPKKIFETLKVPERSKRLMKLQSNIGKLDDSVALLDFFINKQRSNLKTNKKTHKLAPLIYSPTKNNININKRMISLNNDYLPKKKRKHKCRSLNKYPLTPNKSKKTENLKMNSIIDSKKQVLTVKKQKNNEIKNNNETFITRVELPNITNSNNNELDNKKEDFRTKIYKLINQNQDNEQHKNIENNSSPIKLKENSSIKKLLPSLNNNSNKNIYNSKYFNSFKTPQKSNIKQKNEDIAHLMDLNSNENRKVLFTLENEKLNNNLNSKINQKNEKEEEENTETENNKNNNTISTVPNIQEYNKNIYKNNSRNNKVNSLSSSKENTVRLPPIEKLNDMRIGNRKINNNLKQSCFEYDLINWEIKSKFKYVEWKYGIAEIQKYFIDLKEFGQKEENELDFRKSFYEKVEEVIKEIQKKQEKNEVFDNSKNEKKNYIKGKVVLDDEINEYDRFESINQKRKEIFKVMKKNERRQKREKANRNLIDDILFQCKKSICNINRSQNES